MRSKSRSSALPFKNHFCGHEQECARVYRRTFAADDALKFSEEVNFGACMAES
jgi:hypothetical protein